MKAISSILSLALLFSPCDVFGMENEVQQLRGSPALAIFAETMADQNRYSGSARKNADGTYVGNDAWRTNQCVPTGDDCYVGDVCCESGEVCPSCNVGPCQCQPVEGTRNKKANRNRNSDNTGESDARRFANHGTNNDRSRSVCVEKGSDCYIGDICCGSGPDVQRLCAASSPAKSAVEDDFPKLRGSRLLTLAQDFVANQAFDYNAILRQKDKEIKQKGKKQK
ncbi:hypothetical protein ACHAXN_011577 [Cyclotella atomus]